MKQVTTIVLLLTSLGFVGFSHAAYDTYHVYGPGTYSCGTWVEHRKTSNAWYQYAAWVSGFISGAGHSGEELKEVDERAIFVFVDNYCKQNPLNPIVEGAKALLIEIEK